MNWKNFRPMNSKLILKPLKAEVSDVIHMLDYASSTCEVLASADPEYRPGDKVIVDRSAVASFRADDEVWAAFGGAVLARVTEDDQVVPVNGLIAVNEEKYQRIWTPTHETDVLIYTSTDGRRLLATAGTGWIVEYKGKKYRLIHEDDALAEIIED
jgi:co-chaperonin GroES (HSP10)